jgi:dipeptidyl aminopeptidase/acylaminoacyl peptidase
VVRGHVIGFAQDNGYFAWLLEGPIESDLAMGGVGVAVMQNVQTGVRTRLPAHPDGFGCAFEDPQGLAVAGDRAYWQQTCSTQNTIDADVVTASVRDQKLRYVGNEAISRPQVDPLLTPVSDGTYAYTWTGEDPDYVGPIARIAGTKERSFGGPVSVPAALAAGGGRFALAFGHEGPDELAWSPDGKWIAFSRAEDELWLMRADGSDPHRIAAVGGSPSWSPDGTKLVYEGGASLADFGEGAGAVMIANADGSSPRTLARGYDPAWSPDGTELAYAALGGITVSGIDGQNPRVVIPYAVDPAWSPDGSKLAFVKGNQNSSSVMVANADGSDPQTLVESDVYADNLSWSPDGTEIAFTGEGGCSRDLDARTVCEIHPDGTGEQPLRSGLRAAYSPTWGPGGRLAFAQSIVSRVTGGGVTTNVLSSRVVLWPSMRTLATFSPTPITVLTTAGKEGRWIEPGGAVSALAVSQQVLAAIVHEPGGNWAIEIYQPRRRLVPLTRRPQIELSASGMTLVFQVGRGIDVLDASTGSPTRVATTASPAIGLSMVGSRIAWAEYAGSRTRIRTLELP